MGRRYHPVCCLGVESCPRKATWQLLQGVACNIYISVSSMAASRESYPPWALHAPVIADLQTIHNWINFQNIYIVRWPWSRPFVYWTEVCLKWNTEELCHGEWKIPPPKWQLLGFQSQIPEGSKSSENNSDQCLYASSLICLNLRPLSLIKIKLAARQNEMCYRVYWFTERYHFPSALTDNKTIHVIIRDIYWVCPCAN